MNKSVGFILLLVMFTNTMNAELANGKIEEFFIKSGIEERKIRIYYPNNNSDGTPNPLNPNLQLFGSNLSILCSTYYIPADKVAISPFKERF